MAKIFKKFLCALAVMVSHTWAAGTEEPLEDIYIHKIPGFRVGIPDFNCESVEKADLADFNEIREAHNSQPDALTTVPIVGDVFNTHIDRRYGYKRTAGVITGHKDGNPYHALMVRRTDTNEAVASLVFGRVAVTGYNIDEHAGILSFYKMLGVIGEDNTRIENYGLATYVIMADMERIARLPDFGVRDYFFDFHVMAIDFIRRLAAAGSLLPIENTLPTHIVLQTHDLAPDATAMSFRFTRYAQADYPQYGFDKYFPAIPADPERGTAEQPAKITDLWVLDLSTFGY